MFLVHILQLMRLHHWIKNVIIFIPLIITYKTITFDILFTYILIFFSLSFLCSSNYILNDLIDLPSDKLHPLKSKRPLASGNISTKTSISCFLIFYLLAFLIDYAANLSFTYFFAKHIDVTILVFKKLLFLTNFKFGDFFKDFITRFDL